MAKSVFVSFLLLLLGLLYIMLCRGVVWFGVQSKKCKEILSYYYQIIKTKTIHIKNTLLIVLRIVLLLIVLLLIQIVCN